MVLQKSLNIVWHGGSVTKTDRESALGQRGVVLWFTGLSGSGKSTLAREVENRLFSAGHHCYVLDGDNIRFGLNRNLGFSPEDRTENIRRIGEVAKLFADAGIITLTAFISPYRSDREMARTLVAEGEFIEIFTRCSVSECEKRDVKGLYKKARAGEIREFTGISAPYEEPLWPEMLVDTTLLSICEAAELVIDYLKAHDIIGIER